MQKSISIGLLLPASSITPMSKQFESGIKKALKRLSDIEGWEVEIIPEFVGQGSKEKVEAAISKLIGYDHAEIITGIVSHKAASGVAGKFEKSKKILLINNLGEHLPDPTLYNTNVFINSTNLWQQVWALGFWGVKTFGKNGMYVAGLYDAGYSFSAMLQEGMHAADPSSKMPFAIAPVPRPGALADVREVFSHIDRYQPDFIMAAFCGEEANIFLQEYEAQKLHNMIPLLGLPFLGQPYSGSVDVYTSISANKTLAIEEIPDHVKIANNPSPQLGYESGLLITEALMAGGAKGLRESLSRNQIQSIRGPLDINVQSTGNDTHVYIIKSRYANGDHLESQFCAEGKTATISSEEIQQRLKEFSSGWFNPYLCV